jgi:uncharacterized repeat protein (TIGR03803 family)
MLMARGAKLCCTACKNTDGDNPQAPVVFDRAGNLHGTTSTGGVNGSGVVFRLTPDADGAWSETVLHSFQGGDGADPIGGLVIDSAGSIYGTTAGGGSGNCFPGGCGVVFQITP